MIILLVGKGLYTSKLKPLCTAFLHSIIKLSGYGMGVKFGKLWVKFDHLAVQQSNYATKIVNVYIAYDLDAYDKEILLTISNLKIAYLAQLV